ncbi:hypothetical protein DCAR_0623523 [Daucus carota subsp. sativus]|uniref:RING-type E3 ubiquitin transferase n=1 Tax=Daucus carota subsp. sativus TaxID=79200 RepID=A0A164V975_DAUCS|nr:PREDICTED: RING-H2 finger protein ATL3 [Daucus carota subsp. sativus]WOH04115.1 hypothetical protein DCAR_0623523 [Daucus carota subsp. sativus]
MSSSNTTAQKLEESGAMDLTGRIMVVAIIVLFLVSAFVVILHLYAKWYWRRVTQDGTNITRRRRMDFAAGHNEVASSTDLRNGLDPSFLKTIPVVLFSPRDFKDGLECSVCLSEVLEGERTRLLPKCNHGFHVECIDMWFQSHSTCPICRNSVLNSNPTSPELPQGIMHNTPEVEFPSDAGRVSTEALSFPTNVLYWGNEAQVRTLASCLEDDGGVTSSQHVSSSSLAFRNGGDDTNDAHLVIEIPRQINEEEDQKSPLQTRLRSLKKLLNRDRKVNPSSPSSTIDVEQAARTSHT